MQKGTFIPPSPTHKKSWGGKIEKIIEDLGQYNEEERYYRRWYELRDNPKALLEYAEFYGEEAIRKRYLIHPRSIINQREAIKLEENNIFNRDPGYEKRNVLLLKHNRYSPAFEHFHSYFEIFFVLFGSCTNTIGGKRILMTAGQLCFIAPDIHHSLEVIDNSIIINIIIRKSSLDEIFFNILTSNNILSRFFLGNLCLVSPIEYLIFYIDNYSEMVEQFFDMLVEQYQNDIYSDHIMHDMVSIFFFLLVRKHGSHLVAYEQLNSLKERYWDIITYIYKNFKTTTLTKTAKHFNISTAYCSRLIAELAGKNFTILLRDIRMKHAQTILVSSETRIYDISYFLGYENQETFIRAFKKWHGISPGQYRKMHNPAFSVRSKR
jgi:AraC-like DNA-binding protein/mannose-6-phosphate isomerase-like protein (cupin superfamily)